MAAQQLTLTYFDGTGRAELVRLLFTFGGVAFEDKRIQHADMPALKPTLPLGQLPVLEIDGVVYAQSMAIARYAAKRAGLYPQDATQALLADMISETLHDVIAAFVAIYSEKDAEKKAEITSTFLNDTVPHAFRALEKLVQGEFFLGANNASLADVHLFDVVHNALVPVFQFSMTPFPKLESVVAGVKANANVATYLAKHKK